jgi:uncharacterized protein (DUF2141 family)
MLFLCLQLFPRLQQLTRSAVTTVGAAAAQQQELDVGDLAKRITSDVMGSMLLDQDFGGMEMKWVPCDISKQFPQLETSPPACSMLASRG